MRELLPVSVCPVCSYAMDAATCHYDEHRSPVPNDLSLCLKCGEALCFNNNLTLRQASVHDLMALDEQGHFELKRAQDMIRKVRPLDKPNAAQGK